MRKYALDMSIFKDIDTEDKAYWLGFILADGSIYKRKYIKKDGVETIRQSTLKLTLQEKDKNHLVKFTKFMNTDKPIKEYLAGNGANDNKSKCCEIIISSKKIVNDLEKLGVGVRKSHTVKMPEIREDLVKHMIRGIWDGDGSITHSSGKYYSPVAQLCGNIKITKKVQDILYNEIDIQKTKLHSVKSIFLFRNTGIPARKICEYLYKDSNIFLDRKMKLAEEAMKWRSAYKERSKGSYGMRKALDNKSSMITVT